MVREAHHEAGHAVAAEAVGHSVVLLTLDAYGVHGAGYAFCRIALPTPNGSETLRRLVIYSLAGPATDYLLGYSRGTWQHSARNPGGHLTDDRRVARELAGTLTPPDNDSERLWRLTLRLVRLKRAAIERIASELLRRETLSGDDVRELIRET